MFEKSIIYLLFPTIFSSISVGTTIESETVHNDQMSNQQIIEIGVEKIKSTIDAISFEELKLMINNEKSKVRDNSSSEPDCTTTDNCN